jgi:hypothetical protein
MAETGQGDLKCVERAGPDVAEYDTEGGQCQKPRTSSMMNERRLIGGRMRRRVTRRRPAAGVQRGRYSIVHDDLDAQRATARLS